MEITILTSLIIAGVTGICSAGLGTYATVRVLSVRLQYIERDIVRLDKNIIHAHRRIDSNGNVAAP